MNSRLCCAPILLAALALPAMASIDLEPERVVAFQEEGNGRLRVLIEKQPVATYVWADPDIPRPYFCDLRTTSGTQVSRTHPPDPKLDVADHPTFHPGLWLAFGDLDGSDFWRNKSTVRLVPDSLRTSTGVNSGTLEARFDYIKQGTDDTRVCEELFRCKFVRDRNGYMMLWDSTFQGEKPFYFGDQEEMGLGVRVATPLRAERRSRGEIGPGSGTITDSKGRTNGEEVWGNAAPWCDYGGVLGGQRVGVALMCPPENPRPSWFHARDYGLLVANLFGRRAFHHGDESRITVEPGQSLRLRYGVYVYTVPDGEKPALEEAYRRYLNLSSNTVD